MSRFKVFWTDDSTSPCMRRLHPVVMRHEFGRGVSFIGDEDHGGWCILAVSAKTLALRESVNGSMTASSSLTVRRRLRCMKVFSQPEGLCAPRRLALTLCGLAVSQGETAGPRLRGAAKSRIPSS